MIVESGNAFVFLLETSQKTSLPVSNNVGVGRPGPCVMVADLIPIVCPYISQIYDFIAFLVPIRHHFDERALEMNLETGEYLFKGDHSKPGLEEICPV